MLVCCHVAAHVPLSPGVAAHRAGTNLTMHATTGVHSHFFTLLQAPRLPSPAGE